MNFKKSDPEEFAFSPQGKALITGISNAWAKAAADQTPAFYT